MSINEKTEYEVINLGYEYPGMTGGVKWAVITDLPQNELEDKYGAQLSGYRPYVIMTSELEDKYGAQLSGYRPYVIMTSEQGEAFREYDRNENKHDMRSIRHHDVFGYEEGLTEYLNSVFSSNEPEDAVIAKSEEAAFMKILDKLPDAQRRRCILHFCNGLSEAEIARAEGVSRPMITKSLKQAIEKLKIYLKP